LELSKASAFIYPVISRYSRDHWKVIFDINAKGVSEEEYQQTINSLVSILQEVINLNIVCTSQVPPLSGPTPAAPPTLQANAPFSILLHKAGHTDEVTNYRPILLLNAD